jgi:hypothetical protein
MQILVVVMAIFSLNGFLSAGEALEIQGDFAVSKRPDGIPLGWEKNAPGYWEDTAKVSLNKIPNTEKYALQISSQTKAIHLYTKDFVIATGDKCIIKGMVKGKGMGQFGLYFYPGISWLNKGFQATEEWTEFVAELTIHKANPEIDKIRIVLSVGSGASIEFSDIKAEIVKKTQE